MQHKYEERYSLYLWDNRETKFLLAFTAASLSLIRELIRQPYFTKNMSQVNIRKEVLINSTWLCTNHITLSDRQ